MIPPEVDSFRTRQARHMKREAQFLLDRLDEYDPEDENHVKDFHGHVSPAIARLRAALSDKPNPAQREIAPS